MNQDSAVTALIILQMAGFAIFVSKRQELKLVPIKVRASRTFMLFLPALTLVSILVKPLEG